MGSSSWWPRDRWQLTVMSCLVAAAQIGSYFGSPHDGRGLGLDQNLTHIGMGPAQRSISRAPSSGASIAAQIEPRQRSCQLFVAIQPSGCPASRSERSSWRDSPRGKARGIGGRLEDADVGAGLHDQLLETPGRGSLARELPVGRETCPPAIA